MPGVFSVVLITDLRAECAVEVNYNTSKKSSPDSEGKALHFLCGALWMKCLLRKDGYSCATNTNICACIKQKCECF